jgi:hypothetical protein
MNSATLVQELWNYCNDYQGSDEASPVRRHASTQVLASNPGAPCATTG